MRRREQRGKKARKRWQACVGNVCVCACEKGRGFGLQSPLSRRPAVCTMLSMSHRSWNGRSIFMRTYTRTLYMQMQMHIQMHMKMSDAQRTHACTSACTRSQRLYKARKVVSLHACACMRMHAYVCIRMLRTSSRNTVRPLRTIQSGSSAACTST